MCKLSAKLKLCTCSVSSVSQLKHYWILHRYNETKNNIIIGQTMVPYAIDNETLLYNKSLLLQRLNEPDAFDIDLVPVENDYLQLTFTCSTSFSGQITYGYKFKKNKWVENEYDSMEWEWHHDKENFGKIEPALVRKK